MVLGYLFMYLPACLPINQAVVIFFDTQLVINLPVEPLFPLYFDRLVFVTLLCFLQNRIALALFFSP